MMCSEHPYGIQCPGLTFSFSFQPLTVLPIPSQLPPYLCVVPRPEFPQGQRKLVSAERSLARGGKAQRTEALSGRWWQDTELNLDEVKEETQI